MKTPNSSFFDSKIESDATDVRESIIGRIVRYDKNSYTQDWVCNQFYQSVYATTKTKTK